MATIGARLDASHGVGRGFDLLRVVLAFGVVTWHTPTIATNATFEDTPILWFFNYAILPMFFALSGFLIAGSALRLNLRDFIINRALRIVPALAVEVVLCALILGPFFTSLPLRAYFTSPGTYAYFTNIIGRINFHLPGVFSANPIPLVNVSLWTVPFELGCYAIMSMLIVSNLLRRRLVVLVCAGLILALGLAIVTAGYRNQGGIVAQVILGSWLAGRGSALFVNFCLGIAAYLYRDRLPYSWSLFAAALAVCAAVAACNLFHRPAPVVGVLADLPLVYIIAFLGVTRLPKLPLFHRGDYSYGIYLYGWPVMQAMRGWFPGPGSQPLLLWIISVPAIILFAMFSWHTIERRVLRLRKKFSFVARARPAVVP